MIRILLAILLLIPAIAAAEVVGVTVTGPSQQLIVTKQSSTVTAETVTVNASINLIGTEIITVAVPGPQGRPGDGGSGSGGGVTVHNNLSGRDAANAHPATAISGLSTVARTGNYADLTNKPAIPEAQVNSDWTASSGLAQILNKPAIPSTATEIAYNGSTVAAALDQILNPISITSFTLDGGSNITREIGSSYTITTGLVWVTNKSATSQTVNSVARTSPYLPSPSTISTNQTYNLLVSDGQTTANSSRTVTFTHYRYWGVSSAAVIDDAGIIALSKEFGTSRGQNRTFAPVDQYIYIAYLATAGAAATITVNGFLDDSWQMVQRQYINASGYSAEFRIYRSAYRLTGTYVVVVS
ncbi:hypothetical protein KI809_10655 [Geobacter pelophilus]|uniref:Uncharacterized protein n=1 Tax=Geoanaerobacter pelophilus TaxID=60036 RepID=A0AAW4L5F5_9BACT|nr:hypothetical protein [Geoanaerobacter pelophilus]MBT0664760.1 hypothetical protein [Geoanaerobacter pelophilus]